MVLKNDIKDIKYLNSHGREVIPLWRINNIIEDIFKDLEGYEFNAFLNVSCSCYDAEKIYHKIIKEVERKWLSNK